MGSHPLNLTVRFILELSALIAMGIWGWRQSSGIMRVVLAIGVPALAAGLWGTFAVPDDPSRSGKAPVPVPGIVRLVLELLVFGSAVWAVFHMGYAWLSLVFAGIVIVHYAVSYDRIFWLLSQ